jgi:hypothetical protein
LKRNISVYLFNIADDPTESNNLAASEHDKLQELLEFYNSYAAKSDTVMGLSWRYGFQDPDAGTLPLEPGGQRCTGAFNANGGSPYCHFGREWECFVRGREPATGTPLSVETNVTTTAGCQAGCAMHVGCVWWVLRNSTSSRAATCELFDNTAVGAKDCALCAGLGPRQCPGMGSGGKEKAMTPETVRALVGGLGGELPFQSRIVKRVGEEPEDAMATLARLDDAGYFNSQSVRARGVIRL